MAGEHGVMGGSPEFCAYPQACPEALLLTGAVRDCISRRYSRSVTPSVFPELHPDCFEFHARALQSGLPFRELTFVYSFGPTIADSISNSFRSACAQC